MGHQKNKLEERIPRATTAQEIAALPVDTEALVIARLDDAKAEAVGHLQGLRVLYQDGSPSGFSDTGLLALARLPSLEVLDLEWAEGVTDRGLASLHRVATLRWLDLSGCSGVSEPAVEQLRRARPGLEIER
jgi:hypothetical protein